MDLLSKLLKHMTQVGASDLFLSTGAVPALRINGRMKQVAGVKALAPGRTEKMSHLVMRDDDQKVFAAQQELNLACTLPDIGRFRVNVFRQRHEIAMVIRAVSATIPDFTTLGLPTSLHDIVMLKRGLVLLVGPTGSGKSTTLAAMLDHRNTNDVSHIITIEDPIEYIIEHKQSVVNQRELGEDTHSYHNALINALRQSPDVLMVGEIREREILEDAIEFAETGHLCLATLHANNCAQAVERMVNMFPLERHDQVCLTLSQNLAAIASQLLVPNIANTGRVVAVELLRTTSRIRDLIRRGEFDALSEVLEKDTQHGMCTMDQSLFKLYSENRISAETALEYAQSPINLRVQMRLAGAPDGERTSHD